MMKLRIWWLVIVLLLAVMLRGWRLGEIPAGLYVDEAALGYNAFAIWETGADEYGKAWPVFFRSFATYQSGLYTYLAAPVMGFVGLEVWGVRLVSMVAGVVLVGLVTWELGVWTGVVVAMAPVFVLFSRGAFEANLALVIFMLGVFAGIRAWRDVRWWPWCVVALAVSGYAYHGERFLSVLALVYFAVSLWRKYENRRLWVVGWGLGGLVLEVPLLWLSLSSGVNARLSGLASESSGLLRVWEFVRLYVVYWWPGNLFVKGDPDVQRSIPDLGSFYWWMVVPWWAGWAYLVRRWRAWDFRELTLVGLGLVAVLPGAVTNDYFATLRVLPFLVVMAWVVGLGWSELLVGRWRWLSVLLVFVSLVELGRGMVLLKYERSHIWGWQYRELAEVIDDKKVVVDSSRLPPVYILYAFYNGVAPELLWRDKNEAWLADYYEQSVWEDVVEVEDVHFRSIVWEKDIYEKQWLVGDVLAISDDQIQEHVLSLKREIRDVRGEVMLRVVETNPELKCLRIEEIGGDMPMECALVEDGG